MQTLIEGRKIDKKDLKNIVDATFPSKQEKEAKLSNSRSENKLLPLSVLHFDKLNNRFEDTAKCLIQSASGAQHLMESMKTDGLQVPITVFVPNSGSCKGSYVIVDGHQRFAAAKKLGWKEIACRVYYDMSWEEASCIAIVANTSDDATKRSLSSAQFVEAIVRAKAQFKTPTVKLISQHIALVQARRDGRSQDKGYVRQLLRSNAGRIGHAFETSESIYAQALLRAHIICSVEMGSVVARFFLALGETNSKRVYDMIRARKTSRPKLSIGRSVWANFENEVGPDPSAVKWEKIKRAIIKAIFNNDHKTRISAVNRRLVNHHTCSDGEKIISFEAKFKTTWDTKKRLEYGEKVTIQYQKFMKALHAGKAI